MVRSEVTVDAYLMEWGSLLLRWLHVVAAMAWIGSSFFFMHLDASLRPVKDIPPGQGGAAWQVHGGGFYEMRKYLIAPAAMPGELTWHKWQSYTTWLSGFLLLAWIYYAQASLYLVDPAVMPLEPTVAAAIGVGALGLGWLVYDGLCRSPLGRNETLFALVGLGFIAAVSFGFVQIFSGRGALIHIGALMATWMTGNVFLVIIPNQRKVVAALIAGQAPDPALGKQAKQRSTHNNYLTLPVVLLMLSNHYPVITGAGAMIPAIVLLIVGAGGVVRHFYNIRHADHARSPWWAWGVAALLIVLAFTAGMISSPAGRVRLGLGPIDAPATISTVSLPTAPAHVVEIVTSRCAMCHTAEPVWEGIQSPPKGVRLDTPETIARYAPAIEAQSVLSHAMPPNNITEMTEEERTALAAWLATPARM